MNCFFHVNRLNRFVLNKERNFLVSFDFQDALEWFSAERKKRKKINESCRIFSGNENNTFLVFEKKIFVPRFFREKRRICVKGDGKSEKNCSKQCIFLRKNYIF